MILCLVGKSGAGKTYIAEQLEPYINDLSPEGTGCFILDGDIIRAETSNKDVGFSGREKNMNTILSRARWLSDLGFTVIVSAQLPIKEIRDQYLNKNDIIVEIINSGDNPKDELGYNDNFKPDYSDVQLSQELQSFDVKEFYNRVFPKVCIIARFQGKHLGHEIILQEAKRLSPNIVLALRADPEDLINLDKNIDLFKQEGYKLMTTPQLYDTNQEWCSFVDKFDIIVQGNPVVIEKFQESIDTDRVQLNFVPRVGHISATEIREAVIRKDFKFAERYVGKEVLDLLKNELNVESKNESNDG